jgi:transcriptional regulator with XRE-family HTH domain
MNNIRENIGKNLTELRKQKGLTQFEVAEKFHYSDKSVSKWENGDTLPDVETLEEICEFYGVTLDFIIKDNSKEDYAKQLTTSELNNRIAISTLLTSIVWMTATIIFVYTLINKNYTAYWMAFVWAVPVSALILIFMNRIYFRNKLMYFILYSILSWTLLASVFLQLLSYNLWPLFLIGIPLQASLVIWLNIKHYPKKNKER